MKLTKKFSLLLLTLVSCLTLFTVNTVDAASSDSNSSTGKVGFYGEYNPPEDNPGSNNGNGNVVIVSPKGSHNRGSRLPQTGDANTEFLLVIGSLTIALAGYIFIKNKREEKRGF